MYYHTSYTKALPQRYLDSAFYSYYTPENKILRVYSNHQLMIYLNSGYKDMHKILILLILLTFLFYRSGVFQFMDIVIC